MIKRSMYEVVKRSSEARILILDRLIITRVSNFTITGSARDSPLKTMDKTKVNERDTPSCSAGVFSIVL